MTSMTHDEYNEYDTHADVVKFLNNHNTTTIMFLF